MKTTLLSILVAASATAASGGNNAPADIADLTRANLDRTGTQKRPAAATMADGTLLVAWERHEDAVCDENESIAVYLRRSIPNSIVTNETRIDDGTLGNSNIRISTSPSGNAAIAWQRRAPSPDLPTGIFLRLLENATAPLGPQLKIVGERASINDLATLPNRDTIIFHSTSQALRNFSHITPTGAITHGNFPAGVREERIIVLPDSSWIAIWVQESGGLFSRDQIAGRYYSPTGIPGSIIPPFDGAESLRKIDTVTLPNRTHRIVWSGNGPQIPGALTPTPDATFIASRSVSPDGSTISKSTNFYRSGQPSFRFTLHPVPTGGYVAFQNDRFIRFDSTDQPIGGFLPIFPGADFSISRPSLYTTQERVIKIAHTANGPTGVDDADIFLSELDITPQLPRPYGTSEVLATGQVSHPFTATLTTGNTATIWREGTNKIIYSEEGTTITAIDSPDPLTPIGLFPGNDGKGSILYLSENTLYLARTNFSGVFVPQEIGSNIPADVQATTILETNANTALTVLQNSQSIQARLPFSSAQLFTIRNAPPAGSGVTFRKATATRERTSFFGPFNILWGVTDIAGFYTIQAQRYNTNTGEALENDFVLFREQNNFVRDFAIGTTLANDLVLITAEDTNFERLKLRRFNRQYQPIGEPVTLRITSGNLRDLSIVHHDDGFLLTYSESDTETTIKHILLDRSGIPIEDAAPQISSTSFTATPTAPHTALSSFGNGRMVWATVPEFGISTIRSRPIFGPGAEDESRFAAFTGAACIPNDPESDPDGDGYNNTAEFVTGSHPNDPNSIPPPISISIRSNGQLLLRSPNRKGIAPATHQIIETSTDLRIWIDGGNTNFSIDASAPPKKFFRFFYRLTPEDL